MTQQAKVEYIAPTIEKIGDFETTTLHSASGGGLDADFPTGTKFGDLTFS